MHATDVRLGDYTDTQMHATDVRLDDYTDTNSPLECTLSENVAYCCRVHLTYTTHKQIIVYLLNNHTYIV